MKLTIWLINIALLVICSQITEAKDYYRAQNAIEIKFCEKYALAKSERDLRGISDVWNKIKESALKSWNYIQKVAEQTKDKIKNWIEIVKEHAYKVQKEFEVKLQQLKEKINDIITEIHGTGEIVKQCMKKDRENINDILKKMMHQMGECIADEIKKLSKINTDELNTQTALNERDFVNELEEKVDICRRDNMDNIRECLYNIREDVFKNLTVTENDILISKFESRSITDNIKSTLVTCSINNLIHATDLITAEVLQIAKCVIDTKENEIESSE